MSRQALVRQASRSRLVLEQSVLPQLPSADLQVCGVVVCVVVYVCLCVCVWLCLVEV
jgi:hypothetical protein